MTSPTARGICCCGCLERKLTSCQFQEILKKRTRDENDFQLRIVMHPTVLDRLRTEQFKTVSVETNEELASVSA